MQNKCLVEEKEGTKGEQRWNASFLKCQNLNILLSLKKKNKVLLEWVGALSSIAKCCHLHPEVTPCLSSLQRVSL